jgi:aspartyl-tRNA(Asn)/glutamyl-tRNA(Gln) amidotransferase subunit B
MTSKWETVIGLEVHVQLSTASKIFSGAATAFGAKPNAQASAVDIALPGVLPVMNRRAVEFAIRFGLAIDAAIAPRSVFARKNYFYPDSPKGYQISQYELPIVGAGKLEIVVGNSVAGVSLYRKTIRIIRAHLEEDAGKSLHENFHGKSGIDLNRAGMPLLEIVSEPDLRSAAEAVAYAKALRDKVVGLKICDGNMQEGSFRMDANVSVRPAGTEQLGTRCELKNLNSFMFMEKAIEYEIRRQIELIEVGGKVVQETRLYDPDRDETRPMRSKEDAHDYRYFPDPDLLPVNVSEEWKAQIRADTPIQPHEIYGQFIGVPGISSANVAVSTSTPLLADYLNSTAGDAPDSIKKLTVNWISTSTSAALNASHLDMKDIPVKADQLRQLMERIDDQTVSSTAAKEIHSAMWNGEGTADEIIEKRGLRQMSDDAAIEKIVDEVLAANAHQVADYKAGKEKAFNSLVGQVMKASAGKANPAQVNKILKRRLST